MNWTLLSLLTGVAGWITAGFVLAFYRRKPARPTMPPPSPEKMSAARDAAFREGGALFDRLLAKHDPDGFTMAAIADGLLTRVTFELWARRAEDTRTDWLRRILVRMVEDAVREVTR